MRVTIQTWFLFAVLQASRAALHISGNSKIYIRGDDSDGDDSDDDDSGHAHHHKGSASSRHALSKGAIAGIIIGCLIFLLVLLLFILGCRRRRANAITKAREQGVAAAASAPVMKENWAPLLVQHPLNLRPRSTTVNSPTDTIPSSLYYSHDPAQRATQGYHNVPPDTDMDDSTPLPNPYDGDTPPQPPPREEIQLSPVSLTYPTSSYASRSSHISRSQSTAPSSWTHDQLHSHADSSAMLLARGGTQMSRLTSSSDLHHEMADYQKALEAHYRKESEDVGVGDM